MPRIRMCDEDRERYGGPEWVEVETADILDESTGLVEQLEEVWNLSPFEFLNKFTRLMPKGIRALMWLGLWKAGHHVDPWTFKPRTQQFSGVRIAPTAAEERARQAADVVPPVNRAERRAAPKAARKAAVKPVKKAAVKKTTGGASGTRRTAPSGS